MKPLKPLAGRVRSKVRTMRSNVKRRWRGMKGPSKKAMISLNERIRELLYRDETTEQAREFEAEIAALKRSPDPKVRLKGASLEVFLDGVRSGQMRWRLPPSAKMISRLQNVADRMAFSYSADRTGLSFEEKKLARKSFDRMEYILSGSLAWENKVHAFENAATRLVEKIGRRRTRAFVKEFFLTRRGLMEWINEIVVSRMVF
ncbi:MAG: hypothetical protein J4215_05070 [Candidatus Diapherotrites archaeon]|uniref:Uncharacterized protein n=1 Tax=Candidatus Iainarchaeum sp. TaxID=3101447 RepID=A0A8T4LF64_9ARCH|nr:hypothetical protein [Candidatus Diapherotrites archaeon]